MVLVGMGTQIVEVVRIRHLMDRHAEVFLDRVFTTGEQAYCRDRVRTAEHYAAVWAAKEATLRSLGTSWNRSIAWTDLEIDCTNPLHRGSYFTAALPHARECKALPASSSLWPTPAPTPPQQSWLFRGDHSRLDKQAGPRSVELRGPLWFMVPTRVN